VTGTPPGADVRGSYQALGIELPGWTQREPSVAWLAAPGASAELLLRTRTVIDDPSRSVKV
jgi:hypothetical protein